MSERWVLGQSVGTASMMDELGFTPAQLSAPEERVLQHARSFSVVCFRGSGTYDKVYVGTREAARAMAVQLHEGDRGVMIYAVDEHGSSAMIEIYG